MTEARTDQDAATAWAPVTADEAERVLRSVAEAGRDESPVADGRTDPAPRRPATHVFGAVIATLAIAAATYFAALHLVRTPNGGGGASLGSIGMSDGAAFASDGDHAGASQDPAMNRSIAAAVVAMGVAGTACAQGAVQWKVSDGGNGHWYQLVVDAAGLT